MACLIGHGSLKKYSRDITIDDPKIISEILDEMSIPQEIRDILILIKGSVIIKENNLIENDDEIHLFIAVMGG